MGFLAGHHGLSYPGAVWYGFWLIFVGVDNSVRLRGTIYYPSFDFARWIYIDRRGGTGIYRGEAWCSGFQISRKMSLKIAAELIQLPQGNKYPRFVSL